MNFMREENTSIPIISVFSFYSRLNHFPKYFSKVIRDTGRTTQYRCFGKIYALPQTLFLMSDLRYWFYTLSDWVVNKLKQKLRSKETWDALSPSRYSNIRIIFSDDHDFSSSLSEDSAEVCISIPHMTNVPGSEMLWWSINSHLPIEVNIEYFLSADQFKRRIYFPNYDSQYFSKQFVAKNLISLILQDLEHFCHDLPVTAIEYSVQEKYTIHYFRGLNSLLIKILNKINFWKSDKDLIWKVNLYDSIFRFDYRSPEQNGHWFADPFIFEHLNLSYLFVEDFSIKANKGRIAIFEIDSKELKLSHVSIEEDFHISFPFVFSEANRIYLSVECSSVGGIRIYESRDFPNDWFLVDHILQDIQVVDPVFLYLDHVWFMVGTQRSFFGNDFYSNLVVFKSDKLVGGNWRPFGLNPILINPVIGRNAGLIILNDSIKRLSQSFVSGVYGFNIIERNLIIGQKNYVETSSDDLKIRKNLDFIQFHTYTRTSKFEAFDYKSSPA
jgi:hypothetical protein